MKNALFLLPALALAMPLSAQEEPPPNFAAGEMARSSMCVPGLTRLLALEERVAPLVVEAERLQALNSAIGLEDRARVEPFDANDPVEVAVQAWFERDLELALSGDSDAIVEQRRQAREEARGVLVEALQALNARRQAIVEEAGDVQQESYQCGGAILVRSAVLEACESASSAICEAARSEEPGGPIRFVNAAEDIWGVEELRPWSNPTPIRPAPDGSLEGARTAAYSRRGNMVLVVSVETMLRNRSSLDEEEAADWDEHLATMGYSFDHPSFVMAPVLGVYFEGPSEPLGGETHYLLHFGDLQDSDNDLIWSHPVEPGPIEVTFAPGESTFARLVAGDPVSLTAVTLLDGEDAEGAVEGEPIFSMDILSLRQPDAVRGLLTYLAGGQLSQDLTALVSPTEPDGP